jgi:hypothetical protein
MSDGHVRTSTRIVGNSRLANRRETVVDKSTSETTVRNAGAVFPLQPNGCHSSQLLRRALGEIQP